MDLEQIFTPLNTFGMGFALGCIFLVMSIFSHWKTRGDFRRYKSHLSDKLELDAKQIQEVNKERARLNQECENLRLQLARLNEKPDIKLNRELEIMARAERHMMINAPGFAPAWEMAKASAVSQLETEERGMSFPQRIFRKLLGGQHANAQGAIPENATTTATTGGIGASGPVNDGSATTDSAKGKATEPPPPPATI